MEVGDDEAVAETKNPEPTLAWVLELRSRVRICTSLSRVVS
jgi:hypothetical protein